ncbi:MAG: hypothetical protein MUC35_00460 [Candidatus Margulisbacteria bacterium]|nr:hypothetical protein [Candidatus Margulisiibacteriota bacterium]
MAVIIAAGCLALFRPAQDAEFVSWDDGSVILRNEQVRNWSWANTGRIFTSFHFGLYHPLVTLTFAAEHRLSGFDPVRFHADNLFIHAANTLLVFALGWLLSGQPAVAAITAGLFALHPTRVESVAWVMQRKDLLFTCFFLTAALGYLTRRSWLAFTFFVLSLLAKATAISFPFVLLLFDLYQGKKFAWKEKAGYFFLAALFGVVAVMARIYSGDLTRDPPFGPANIFIGAYRLLFYYLPRLLWPWHDYPLYPGPSFAQKYFTSLPWLYWLAPALSILIVVAFYRLFRADRRVLFGGAFFLVTLFPSLFLISVGPFADRYTYIPALGLFFLVGIGAVSLWQVSGRIGRGVLAGGLVVLFLSLVLLTSRQLTVWQNSVTLWERACRQYPQGAEAFNNRGLAYIGRGELELGERDLSRARELAPDNAGISRNLRKLADVFRQRERARAILNQRKNSGRMGP